MYIYTYIYMYVYTYIYIYVYTYIYIYVHNIPLHPHDIPIVHLFTRPRRPHPPYWPHGPRRCARPGSDLFGSPGKQGSTGGGDSTRWDAREALRVSMVFMAVKIMEMSPLKKGCIMAYNGCIIDNNLD